MGDRGRGRCRSPFFSLFVKSQQISIQRSIQPLFRQDMTAPSTASCVRRAGAGLPTVVGFLFLLLFLVVLFSHPSLCSSTRTKKKTIIISPDLFDSSKVYLQKNLSVADCSRWGVNPAILRAVFLGCFNRLFKGPQRDAGQQQRWDIWHFQVWKSLRWPSRSKNNTSS